MREDRRESPDIHQRIPSNQRILTNERDRRSTLHGLERVNEQVYRLREHAQRGQRSGIRSIIKPQEQREQSGGKLERAVERDGAGATERVDPIIGRFEQSNRRCNTAKT